MKEIIVQVMAWLMDTNILVHQEMLGMTMQEEQVILTRKKQIMA